MDDNDRLIEGIDNIYKTIFHGVGVLIENE